MQSKLVNKKHAKPIPFDKLMVYIIFVIVFVFFSILLEPKGFLNITNLLNILRQTAVISIMAVGGTFVMASGQIDLTVGAVAAMSSVFSALVLQKNGSIILSVLAGICFGTFVGLINGLLVTKLRLPAFLATLGVMQLVRGSAMKITDTSAIPIDNDTFTYIFGAGSVGSIPILVFWTMLIYLIGAYIFYKSSFGRHVLATGGNRLSAEYSGIKTEKVLIISFIISGLLAGLGGVLYAGRLSAGRFSYGDGDEMSVIAAVVLGGTAMSGGTGAILGSLVGSLLMGIINNALILANLSSAEQMMIRGAIIVVSVAVSNLTQKIQKAA
ncbi:MAG TPA: ABC transporter permease [Clostridiaceae bacterium]|jgi:ribose/xylose/arabinose/galactoside ABC-type transport system permease subunit|nr:ABC transporter permease [Clostridiaceae bacterium]